MSKNNQSFNENSDDDPEFEKELEQFKDSLDKIFTGPPMFMPKLIPNCSQDWVSSLVNKNRQTEQQQRRNSTPPQSPQPSKTASKNGDLDTSSITMRDRSESSPNYFLNKINLDNKQSSGSQQNQNSVSVNKQMMKMAPSKRKWYRLYAN